MKAVRDKAGNNAYSIIIGADRTFYTSPVAGEWTLFARQSPGRDEMSLQNLSAGDLYFVAVPRDTTGPVAGPLAAGDTRWQLHVPADPAFFIFPKVPSGDIWVRSTVASAGISQLDS